MLSTANILGPNWPEPLQVTPKRGVLEIRDSVRSAKLVLNVTAKVNGYLKMRWAWQDSAGSIWSVEEGNPISSNSSFRILINGGWLAKLHWHHLRVRLRLRFTEVRRSASPLTDAWVWTEH
jgi:hypothetical protein